VSVRLILILALFTASPAAAQMAFVERPDGIEVTDAGRPVLFYRTRPGPAPAEPWRLHYIHPLHAPDGTVLTEDRPEDHLHQRGLFQAWRRILLDGRQVGDTWVMNRVVYEVKRVAPRREADGSAAIEVTTDWTFADLGPLIEETTLIRVEPMRDGGRGLALETTLRALRPGVALAGTDDDKAYSGPSVRFVRPDLLSFSSGGRPLTAAVGAVETDDAVVFAWPAGAGTPAWTVSAACSADGRPWRRWILRRELSMQTCAFPGRAPHALDPGRPLRLVTRFVIAPANP